VAHGIRRFIRGSCRQRGWRHSCGSSAGSHPFSELGYPEKNPGPQGQKKGEGHSVHGFVVLQGTERLFRLFATQKGRGCRGAKKLCRGKLVAWASPLAFAKTP
jgi:hypothetical protein